jgi:hypothetical protein
MAKIGTPMRDVSFFLTMGVESGDRRRDEQHHRGAADLHQQLPARAMAAIDDLDSVSALRVAGIVRA